LGWSNSSSWATKWSILQLLLPVQWPAQEDSYGETSHWPILHRYFVFPWMSLIVPCIEWQIYQLPRVQPIQPTPRAPTKEWTQEHEWSQ
jgi:hypothetical protein